MTNAQQPLKYQKLWVVLGITLIVGVVLASLLPIQMRSTFAAADKVQHALAYASLTGWFLLIFHGFRAWLTIVVFALLLGAGIEIAQSATSYRFAEWMDMLANILGVILGSVVAVTPMKFSLMRLERLSPGFRFPGAKN